jgi:hypothetical protein
MANEKVETSNERIGRRMVEVWASTVDALLQQWLEQGKREDRLGMAITSAKLAQVGFMMTRFFKQVCEEFCDGDTEVKAARQAIEQVDAMIRRAMAAAGVGEPRPSVQKETSGLN